MSYQPILNPHPVTGTFWQATQPVSLASLPALATGGNVIGAVSQSGTWNVAVSNASLAVTGTFWQVTQPISAASLPLPAGAATAAKQPALGTAGTASTDVITVQGIASGVAQPVSISSMPSTPVTGTFWQATQPVSIASTVNVVTKVDEATATFRGRVATFRTPGRAGTTGQKIFALHNATGSTKVVHLNQLTVDCLQTVVIAVTVLPPIIRVYRFTAVPTNGTALTKVAKDTALVSNASITAWGDASADGTGSGTTLTVTLGSALTQEFAPRLITAAGYEMFDRTDMLTGFDVVLRPLEGICVMLDYTTTTANPTTTHWVATADWYEV